MDNIYHCVLYLCCKRCATLLMRHTLEESARTSISAWAASAVCPAHHLTCFASPVGWLDSRPCFPVWLAMDTSANRRFASRPKLPGQSITDFPRPACHNLAALHEHAVLVQIQGKLRLHSSSFHYQPLTMETSIWFII